MFLSKAITCLRIKTGKRRQRKVATTLIFGKSWVRASKGQQDFLSSSTTTAPPTTPSLLHLVATFPPTAWTSCPLASPTNCLEGGPQGLSSLSCENGEVCITILADALPTDVLPPPATSATNRTLPIAHLLRSSTNQPLESHAWSADGTCLAVLRKAVLELYHAQPDGRLTLVGSLWPSFAMRCVVVGKGLNNSNGNNSYVVAMAGTGGVEIGQMHVKQCGGQQEGELEEEEEEIPPSPPPQCPLQGQPVNAMAFSRSESRLAFACLTGRIGMWSLSEVLTTRASEVDKKPPWIGVVTAGKITCLAFSLRGDRLAVAVEDGKVVLFHRLPLSSDQGIPLFDITVMWSRPIMCCAVLESSAWRAYMSLPRAVMCPAASVGRPYRVPSRHGGVFVVWSGDSKYVACSDPRSTTITAYSSQDGWKAGAVEVQPGPQDKDTPVIARDVVTHGLSSLIYHNQSFIQQLDSLGRLTVLAWSQGVGQLTEENDSCPLCIKQWPAGRLYLSKAVITTAAVAGPSSHLHLLWDPARKEQKKQARLSIPIEFARWNCLSHLTDHNKGPLDAPDLTKAAAEGLALDVVVDPDGLLLALVFPYAIYLTPLSTSACNVSPTAGRPEERSTSHKWTILEGFDNWVRSACLMTSHRLAVVTEDMHLHLYQRRSSKVDGTSTGGEAWSQQAVISSPLPLPVVPDCNMGPSQMVVAGHGGKAVVIVAEIIKRQLEEGKGRKRRRWCLWLAICDNKDKKGTWRIKLPRIMSMVGRESGLWTVEEVLDEGEKVMFTERYRRLEGDMKEEEVRWLADLGSGTCTLVGCADDE